MNRFIAITWNSRAAHAEADAAALITRASEAHPDWRRRWERPGVLVLEAPHRSRAEAGLDLGERALLLGAVFNGDKIARVGDIDVGAFLKTGGAHAFGAVWGRYILFVEDKDNACVYVARDPSGALPCYMAQRGWAFAFFSDPTDLPAIAIKEIAIDWRYVAHKLAAPRAVLGRTGIEGVTMLPAGAIARVGQGQRSMRRVWSPGAVARQQLDVDQAAAKDILQHAVERACAGWARYFDRAGLRLSGGLDSSLVLACVSGRAPLHAINFATPSADGDERAYARAAAACAGIDVHEVTRAPECVDLTAATSISPAVCAPLWLADGETAIIEAQFARERQLAAFFSGRGGDNVFFRAHAWEVAADWARARGFGPSFLAHCVSHARHTGAPFLASAWRALFAALGREAGHAIGPPAFMSAKAIELAEIECVECGAAMDLDALPPGKRLHIAAIEDRLNYFDPRPHADYIYPLTAQPVLEACLRLPTYVLAPPGLDRGLARAAFAGRIAPAILQRGSKGRTSTYLARIVLRQRRFLRDYLAAGALAEAGMIEPAVIVDMLSEAELMRSPAHLPRIVSLLSLEAWLQSLTPILGASSENGASQGNNPVDCADAKAS